MTLREYIAALSKLDQDAEVITFDSGCVFESSVENQPYRQMHRDPYGGYSRCFGDDECPMCRLTLPLVKVVVIG